MGKKKKKVAKTDDTKPEAAAKDGADAEAEDGEAAPAKEEAGDADSKEKSMEAYKAAAVLFFTRGADGRVEKVLLAVEERKVQASMMGLNVTGSVMKRVVVFPQGRKEKKDKNDPVETAKREFIEETTDYGNLSRYLDFADFGGEEDEDPSAGVRDSDDTWTGSKNLAVYFSPGGMVVLFCEVKPGDAKQPAEDAKLSAERVEAAEPVAKKTKIDRKPSPSYRIGKMGHLKPCWIEADALRRALTSGDRAPILAVSGEEARLFPTNASALKLPEVRVLLGLPERPATESGDAKQPSEGAKQPDEGAKQPAERVESVEPVAKKQKLDKKPGPSTES